LCHSPVRDRACGRRGGLLSGWHIGSVHDDQPLCHHVAHTLIPEPLCNSKTQMYA
jgi:hypothetical protein